MTDRSRLQRLSALLDEGLDLSPVQRVAWLAGWRDQDPALADEVERLLNEADGPAANATTGLARQDRWMGLLAGALVETPDLPAIDLRGRRLGAWVLECKIGEGGMGQVWQARRADGLYEASVAIKLLRGDLPAATFGARFARERAVLARLNHPGIARLLDAGIEGETAYLVLERIHGSGLSAHVRAHCPSVESRVRLLLRIAEAVAYAHSLLVVHRDLKPSNVLVTEAGEPKLLDFGVAGWLDEQAAGGELTRQTGRGLTPGYAAPEQICGAPIGTAADVFSLGVMLHDLLTGDLPFGQRGTPRVAVEHAVLHLEPQRVWPPPAADPPEGGPGRPVDPERTRGDLAAVVATALRKDPARRYASVPALIDDLQCWLEHRPVSVRRDNRRHRLRLWLRRHAWLVGTGSTVAGGLLIALGFSIWQWQRAESAARTADRVTQYLSELLISASPDRHGGQWPTVLQVLEQQRKDLLSRFHDDPMTRMRLLQTLSRTYRELNRFDLAVPVAEEWLTLSRQHLGPDHPMTLRAGLDLAHALQILGVADRSVAVARPLVAPVRAAFGPMSDELHRLLYVLESSLLRSGRLDEADRMLAEAGQITDAKTRPGDYDRLSHLNRLQVLRTTQGRLHEALAAINATEPYWGRVQAGDTREWLTFRRNQIAVQIRLSWFDVDIEARGEALMADIARILPRGNDMIAGLRQELARYHSDLGQPLVSLRLRAQALQELQAAGVTDPATLLPRRAQLLMARGQAGEGTPAGLRSEAQALLAEGDAVLPRLGYVRVELWMALARLGLLLDDAPLAAAALQRLRADPAFSPTGHAVWASRIDALEGALARLQDDLPRSRALLLRRLTHLDTYTEPAIHGTWAAVLDLAFTQVLLGDPQAAATLRRAARHRPPSLPADHALDAVTAYLAARLAHGDDNAAPVRQAWSALARRLGRPDMPPPSGRGLLWGALLAFA